MPSVRKYKLAAIFQQILPGMFQESEAQNLVVTKQQDKEGKLFWQCFHCKAPIRNEQGLYITEEEDIENFERYTKYEETLSSEDILSAEKLEEARTANNVFYNNTRVIIDSFITDIKALSEEELEEAVNWITDKSEFKSKLTDIHHIYDGLLSRIQFLFNKHYYYNNPEIYDRLSKIKNELQPSYWMQLSVGMGYNFHFSLALKARLYLRITDILNGAGERHQLINEAIALASQAAGTKKHLIQRHIINHPVCDRCHENIGAECYVPSCNFTSPDIEDDFLEIEVSSFDENTNKTYVDTKLFCEEHGFKCDACGKNFISDPFDLFGDCDETHGYGQQVAFGEPYCDDCFHELFRNCELCNELFNSEDLVYDEKRDMAICNTCNAGRGAGVEDQLTSEEIVAALAFADDPFGVGDTTFYPIDFKTINTQILPALKKSSNKRFGAIDQWESWLMKRIQSKDAKAAVLVELNELSSSFPDILYFQDNQKKIIDRVIESFARQSEQAAIMAKKYPGLRGYKPLAVNVTVEKTSGHKGHSFVIYPKEKLINYAEMVMPGARDAYDTFLKNIGHHSGALAYARFTKSNGKIVVDNLQTDLDSQAFDIKNNKPLQWWLTAIKKFWVPFMLNLLHQYGQNTGQKVYLTSFKMQQKKWRTIPERNKDIYDRTPEAMGFRLKNVEVKPEDLLRREYNMRRIAAFVGIFCKLAHDNVY